MKRVGTRTCSRRVSRRRPKSTAMEACSKVSPTVVVVWRSDRVVAPVGARRWSTYLTPSASGPYFATSSRQIWDGVWFTTHCQCVAYSPQDSYFP